MLKRGEHTGKFEDIDRLVDDVINLSTVSIKRGNDLCQSGNIAN